MRRSLSVYVGVAVSLVLGSVAGAQTSASTVTYQGVLTQNGAPVPDGAHTLTFTIYDAASGGSVVETIGVPGVQTTQGRFAALVPVAPASFDGSDRWWSVTFNGTELPRQKVTAVPYSIATRGIAVSDTGNVGIGTSSPELPLDLVGQCRMDTALWLGRVLSIGGPSLLPPTVSGISVNTTQRDAHFRVDNGVQSWILAAASPGGQSERTLFLQSLGNTDGKLLLGVGGQPFRVGIQNANPQTALDVGGEVRCQVLSIMGADLAEKFDVVATTKHSPTTSTLCAFKPLPGMVVSIDPTNPGKLMVSSAAYDTKVAGAISGANGLDAGVILGKGNPSPLIEGEHPVAMSGRVYVWCDASYGAISAGDMLTTSATPGHAMKAADREKSFGAVIGKAMTELKEGKGMVLVLVNLQ